MEAAARAQAEKDAVLKVFRQGLYHLAGQIVALLELHQIQGLLVLVHAGVMEARNFAVSSTVNKDPDRLATRKKAEDGVEQNDLLESSATSLFTLS